MQETLEVALQHFFADSASKQEIALLKQALSVGQIAIGGNVNNSIIIVGSGNSVALPPGAIDVLDARALLGDLERDLTGDEIAVGLTRLNEIFPERAPCLLNSLQTLAKKLSPFIQTVAEALSASSRKERLEALAALNALCIESLDIPFNALCLGKLPPEYDTRCPFRGLESFGPEEAEFFFGRETLVEELVLRLNEHHFLAVLGASGSGKSSLVQAGLIPKLQLSYKVIRPGTEALPALEQALEADPALLVVDQLEELFTLTKKEQRAGFVALLLETAKKCRVVVILRADFWGEVAVFRALKDEIQQHQELISPLEPAELLQAIEAQARQVGLRFEADLSQQMVDHVTGEPGAMPLLQHALWTLWLRRHGRWLKAEEYRAFGGVKEAIAITAEEVYAQCSEAERGQLKDIFLRLTRLDEGAEHRDTRRRVLLRDLLPTDGDAAALQALIKKLADRRLVVSTEFEVEVAHEALIQHWKRLRGWLNTDRESQLLLQIVREDALRWEKAGGDKNLLNQRGARLKAALALQEKRAYRLSLNEQKYLEACVQAEKRSRLLGIGILVFFLALAGSLGWIFVSTERPIPGRWVTIPAGSFVMGMDEEEAELAAAMCLEGVVEAEKQKCLDANTLLDWSGRQKQASLAAYDIMDNEVTIAQYQQCLDEGGCQTPADWIRKRGQPNLPVTNLNWFQAGEYCAWLGGRLPTDGEWEKAARGPNNFIFPWGNTWEPSRANLERYGKGAVQAIDQFAATDLSGYGVKNLAGNVLEWTASEGMPVMLGQQFSNVPFELDDDTQDWPVILRGGAWSRQRSMGMASNREGDSVLSHWENLLGFRCVCPTGQICQAPWNGTNLTWVLIWLGR